MLNFYNSKEITAMLSVPPFAFNTHDTVQVLPEDNETIKLQGTKEMVENAVRSLTDPRSTHTKHFARHKVFFQAQPIMKEDSGSSAILKIGSRRKW